MRFLYQPGDKFIDLGPYTKSKFLKARQYDVMKRIWNLGLEDPSKMNFVSHLCPFVAVKLDKALITLAFISIICKSMITSPSSIDCHEDQIRYWGKVVRPQYTLQLPVEFTQFQLNNHLLMAIYVLQMKGQKRFTPTLLVHFEQKRSTMTVGA